MLRWVRFPSAALTHATLVACKQRPAVRARKTWLARSSTDEERRVFRHVAKHAHPKGMRPTTRVARVTTEVETRSWFMVFGKRSISSSRAPALIVGNDSTHARWTSTTSEERRWMTSPSLSATASDRRCLQSWRSASSYARTVIGYEHIQEKFCRGPTVGLQIATLVEKSSTLFRDSGDRSRAPGRIPTRGVDLSIAYLTQQGLLNHSGRREFNRLLGPCLYQHHARTDGRYPAF